MVDGSPSVLGRRLQQLKVRFLADGFVRQVGTLMMLTAAGQGIYVLAGPFIGRLYSPEEVGIFGLFFALWTALAPFVCGLFDIAIAPARDDRSAENATAVALVCAILVSMLAAGGFALAITGLSFGMGVFPLWAPVLLFAVMLLHGMVLILNAWAIRKQTVLSISRANFSMNLTRSVLQVTGGFVVPFWAVLAAGEVVARAGQVAMLARSAVGAFSPKVRFSAIWEKAVAARQYPMIFGPAFAMDSAATLLQTAMLGALFGVAEMGQYFMMRRTLDLPVAFIFRSLSDLYLARYLGLIEQKSLHLRRFFGRSVLLLAGMGVAALLPVVIWGEVLFRLFYGGNWGVAGTLAAIMAPAFILNFAVAPVSRIFEASAMPQLRLVPGVVNLSGSLVAYGATVYFDLDFYGAVACISAAVCVYYLCYLVAGFMAARTRMGNGNDNRATDTLTSSRIQ